MSSLIQTLNLWGESVPSIAWPLLWQSSLLIGLLFGLDRALRQRVRAAVRYGLWLVVLIKLLLPPSLALPTGLAWWLSKSHPEPPAKSQPTFVVTYSGASVQRSSPVAVIPRALPPPKVSLEGWALLVWAGVGLALLGWLGVRWWWLAGDIHRGRPGAQRLEDLLTAARREAGVRRRVRLRVTDRPMSPAVCGLLRPAILLPRRLIEHLSPAQLRAVLLHELVHLRRGDVWVNCLQSLLQIVYWWHPLFWLANARIRRVREEAVDDAVVLALRSEADHYAPTLLEVARLAFHRPLASLGLVGILESRSVLRQRIERLVNIRPPKKAGLSAVAMVGIAVFAAVAVPMGEAPSKTTAATNTPLTTRVFKVDPNTFYQGLESVGVFTTGSASRTNGAGQHFITRTNVQEDVHAALENYFATLGVNLKPPKALFWNDWTGKLLVHATPQDLEVIESAIQFLNEAPPHIHISAKFIELPEDACKTFLAQWGPASNSVSGGFTGILAPPQARKALKELEGKSGVDIISSPGLTTLSGRQGQIQMVDIRTIVTGLTSAVTNGVTNFMYETQPMPFGPVLDVLPTIGADGHTISMTVLPTVTEFIGYDAPPKEITTNPINQPFERAQLPLPVFRVRQLTSSAIVWDGQTLVMGNFPDRLITRKPDGSQGAKDHANAKQRQLLVFVTPTIVDPSGKRIHPDDETPSMRDNSPP
jgi:beta-lactamase regulating signal transducer with metallopeptidase domain